MLKIEEYIARRKKEDRLNEFNLEKRSENMRICVNYIFEYFNNYLDITEVEEKTVLINEKLDKYRQQLRDYEPEVRDWLVNIKAEYNKNLNHSIGSILKKDEFFFLYNSEHEFRSLSYDCYAKLIKKHPYLKDQSEMLFMFIKGYHRIQGQERMQREIPFISEEINNWIDNTCIKYQVSVVAFAERWVYYFSDNEDLWPATHRQKSQESWRKYDYIVKGKSNIFNLNSLYRRMPRKPYTRGKKQEFEVLMMHYWLHSIEGDEEGYWQEYLEKVLPEINKS